LRSVTDSTLVASYISPLREYYDVENIVFYNVGTSSFAHLQCKRIHFERVVSPVPASSDTDGGKWNHYLSYILLNEGGEFTHWEPIRLLAEWEDLSCGGTTSPYNVVRVWYGLKLGAGTGRVQRLVASEIAPTNLGLEVRIHAPKNTRLNLTSAIKPVCDGIMASFSKHDGSFMDSVTKRLAPALGIDHEEFEYLLQDEGLALLGTRRLVWPRGKGVQWNPNDDLLVLGKLSLGDRSADREWRLSGELFEVRSTIEDSTG
jgi:hypothetical protein